MDAGRTGGAFVRPLGHRRWIGVVLGVFSILGAIRAAVSWLFTGEVFALLEGIFTVCSGAALVILPLLAAASSESLPDRGAFAVLAGSQLFHLLGLVDDAGLLLPTILTGLACLLRAAAWAVIGVDRENTRDARGCALICAGLWAAQGAAAVLANAAAWSLTRGGYAALWVRILQGCGSFSLLLTIAAGVIGGTAWLLLRESVPEPDYPEKHTSL